MGIYFLHVVQYAPVYSLSPPPPHHENENDHADFMVNFAEYVH